MRAECPPKHDLWWRFVTLDHHFSKHHYPKLYSTYIHWTTRDIFQYPTLIPDTMYGLWPQGPLSTKSNNRQTQLMEKLINVLVCETPLSPSSTLPHPSAFLLWPLTNNQRWSHYYTYEINLLPTVHRVMLLQENQCPSCCSLGLDRVYAHLLS